MSDSFAAISEILKRHGGRSTPEEFHAALNVTFHRFESEHYDEGHQNMWQSLPAQVNLIAEDCIKAGNTPEQIRMLDIGCGTGLATDCLLRSPLGPRVHSVDLLDTSTSMLDRANARRRTWDKPGGTHEGFVESLVGEAPYDLIITCSVLHHVPDLPSFLRSVSQLQEAPGSLFVHLQDPNGDYMDDPELKQRASETKELPEWVGRLHPRRILGRLVREIKGEQGNDYLTKTNRELMQQGVITSPLTTAEIFSIIDIHVQNGQGISTEQLRPMLPDYELVSRRSYGFFGALWSDLNSRLRTLEEDLIRKGASNGGHVAAAWKRN